MSFNLKCLGKPLADEDVPRLPPAAAKSLFGIMAKYALDPSQPMNGADPRVALAFEEIAVAMVHATARRIKPSVTLAEVDEQEDFDAVMQAFAVVKARNPALFPPENPAPVSDAVPTQAPDPR